MRIRYAQPQEYGSRQLDGQFRPNKHLASEAFRVISPFHR
jgi:hypothetical protein